MSPSSQIDTSWPALRRLSQREWEDGSAALEVLEQWRRGHGADGAAVYAPAPAGGFVQELWTGRASLPARFSERPSLARFRELPCGLLLVWEGGGPAPTEGSPEDPSEYLLSATVQLSRLGSLLKEQSFRGSFHAVKMEALYDVGLAIASTLNLEQLTEDILMHAVALLDARRGALFLLEGDRYRLKRAIGGSARETVPVDDPVVGRLLASERTPEQDLLPDALYSLAVPIEIDGAPRGLLVVADKESRTGVGPFAGEDRRSLSLFASQAAIALENASLHKQALEKERLEREMELAAEIQRSILPARLPEVSGIELAGWNQPTRQVGGDYYGSFPLAGGGLGLVVADVTGKGMPAALLVSTLHSALKLLLDRGGAGEELLAKLNEHIHESSGSNKFITLILVQLSDDREELGYLNAGHNPGLLLRRDGTLERLEPSGLPLGLLRGTRYRFESRPLCAGDLLCLYSDGITECESQSDEEFGVDRLVAFLRERLKQPLEEIMRELERTVRHFSAGRPQGDDQTVVLVRRVGARP